MLRKIKGQWVITSHRTGKILGRYKSKQAARRRLKRWRKR